jgi:hypothetical protein
VHQPEDVLVRSNAWGTSRWRFRLDLKDLDLRDTGINACRTRDEREQHDRERNKSLHGVLQINRKMDVKLG